jgi:2,3,4,5-tetrahydropyridine-2-carboxylate N-succinyltransferase
MNESPLRGQALLRALELGEVRVAERSSDGAWSVNTWVKDEILQCFRDAGLVRYVVGDPVCGQLSFVDKAGLGPQQWDVPDGVRVVPGGTAIRRGAHLGAGVIVMPPAYVNVGAFVDEGSMIDSHALVGSCAQIGKRVHVSAAAQIGGVLEPAGARPVIVEDDAFVGGNCGVYEGVLVRRGAVLAAGVVLSASTPVFDLVQQRELRGSRAAPLEIPENAVVIPGTRPASKDGALDAWAASRGLQVACALIVKYRDASTDRATALEDALR